MTRAPSAGRSTSSNPITPVSTASSSTSHHWLMPKRLASTATWILNRPSASTGMPNITHRNVMASPGWHSVMIPTAMSRMPNARSY